MERLDKRLVMAVLAMFRQASREATIRPQARYATRITRIRRMRRFS